MTSVSCFYLLAFLPLIASLFCLLIPFKRLCFWVSILSILSAITLVTKNIPDLINFKSIGNDYNLALLSLSLEFRLNLLSATFLIIALTAKAIILIYFKSDVEELLDDKNKGKFYAAFLVNLFALINIFTTNRYFNLFVFLEIYAFSFFAISSISKDCDLLKISFRDFCLNVASSILLLLSFLVAFLIFKKSGFDQPISSDISGSNLIILLLIFFVSISILFKFFPFWLFFEKMKNANSIASYLIAESMVVKGIVGFFIAMKFVYFFFGKDFIFANEIASQIFLVVGIILVIFGSIGVYQQKHLQPICGYFCLVNSGFIICAISLNNEYSLRSIVFYLINFGLVNLFIFCLSSFLKKHLDSSSFSKIRILKNNHKFIALPLKLSIFFIASFPLTPMFFGNWNLAYVGLNPSFDSAILIALVVSNFVNIELSLRLFDSLYEKSDEAEEGSAALLSQSKASFYSFAFWAIILLISYVTLFAANFGYLSQNLASYLLSI
jgi:multicomponent Na+:H+ antiporter subunit D